MDKFCPTLIHQLRLKFPDCAHNLGPEIKKNYFNIAFLTLH